MAQEFREMQLNHYQLREKYDDLVEKMKFFTKVSYFEYFLSFSFLLLQQEIMISYSFKVGFALMTY